MKKMNLKLTNRFSRLFLGAFIAAFTLVSCDSDSEDVPASKTAAVTLQFNASNSASPKTQSMARSSAVTAKTEGDTLFIAGTNGTLRITEVHFIVDEFELEKIAPYDNSCEDLEGQAEDDCEEKNDSHDEFEMGMSFVQLPIGQGTISINTSDIKAGVYGELEFEVDNLDADEDDSQEEIAAQEAVLNDIKAAGFTNWPEEASMVVIGTFESTNGDITDFTTYVEAEISIEMLLDPALDITNGNAKSVTINMYPEKWFATQSGTVIDLSLFSDKLLQLDFEVEGDNGFESEVEVD